VPKIIEKELRLTKDIAKMKGCSFGTWCTITTRYYNYYYYYIAVLTAVCTEEA